MAFLIIIYNCISSDSWPWSSLPLPQRTTVDPSMHRFLINAILPSFSQFIFRYQGLIRNEIVMNDFFSLNVSYFGKGYINILSFFTVKINTLINKSRDWVHSFLYKCLTDVKGKRQGKLCLNIGLTLIKKAWLWWTGGKDQGQVATLRLFSVHSAIKM